MAPNWPDVPTFASACPGGPRVPASPSGREESHRLEFKPNAVQFPSHRLCLRVSQGGRAACGAGPRRLLAALQTPGAELLSLNAASNPRRVTIQNTPHPTSKCAACRPLRQTPVPAPGITRPSVSLPKSDASGTPTPAMALFLLLTGTPTLA